MQQCSRCNKSFSNKSNLTRHLRRQNQCVLFNTLNMVSDDHNPKEVTQNNTKVTQSNTNGYHKGNTNTLPEITQWICEFCDTTFGHKNSLYRHKKHYCKFIKSEKVESELIRQLLEMKYDNLKLEKEISNENYGKLKAELELKISQLEDKIIEQHQIISQTTINGNVNQGTVNNVITNNIIINNFGEEQISLTSEEVEQIMAAGYDMHRALGKKIHIDNPENRNFMIFSMKDKHAIIIQNGERMYVNRIDTIDKFVTGKTLMLEDLLKEHGKNFKEINPIYAGDVINFCSSDQEECKRIRGDVTLLFINNKDTIKNTIDTNNIKNI